jgi:hypothetical protein
MIPPAAPECADARAYIATKSVCFTHTVRTKANSIRFAHQSFCSPKISTLLKALRRGYLKGCPNLTVHGVTKYLNPSPATAKGHMKQPCQGIQSTKTLTSIKADVPTPLAREKIAICEPPRPLQPLALHPNVIEDGDIANMMLDANLYCLRHLQISTQGRYTITSLVHFHSCR